MLYEVITQELQEGGPQLAEVATIGVHVVRLDIGDDGDHGLQVQEA